MPVSWYISDFRPETAHDTHLILGTDERRTSRRRRWHAHSAETLLRTTTPH